MHVFAAKSGPLPDPPRSPEACPEPSRRVATGEGKKGRSADVVASMTIVLVAGIALVMAWVLPWWVMKARAPQYGQRTLVVEVGPRDVGGDVREIDMLGHYVG